ncbi:YceI family protein [Phycisphaerales bacterium AB-hyl4]|uniref:YceI family protein n=1 Tax=Natronomicrosphaera hydrolytica TaxID=3242702 RepID=A0ABV4U4P6_9BACT
MQTLTLLITAGIVTVTLSTCISTGVPTPAATEPTDEQDTNEQVSETTFALAEGSAIRLAGSATIGSWDCAGYQAESTFTPGAKIDTFHEVIDHIQARLRDGDEVDPDHAAVTLDHDPIATIQVRIDSLGCGNSAMERDMQGALKADDHPDIHYELDRVVGVTWSLSSETNRPVLHVATEGYVSLAGERQAVEMDVRIERVDEHRFTVLGSKKLDMRDFDVKPPSALFGLIRADPAVTVIFDLIVEPQRSDAVDSSQTAARN